MKKIFAWLLAVTVMFGCLPGRATAVEGANLYDLLTSLLDGHTITLTVTPEEIDLPEDMSVDEMIWMIGQDEDAILLEITYGDWMVKAVLTSEGIRLETPLEALRSAQYDWETLNPQVTLTEDGDSRLLKVSMTGPNQELINFTAKLTGAGADNYAVSLQAGLITGPGEIYGIYDDFGARDGISFRSTAYTWDEYMLSAEGEGEEVLTEAEDGTQTLSRTDRCTILLDDDEIGTLTLRRVFEIR